MKPVDLSAVTVKEIRELREKYKAEIIRLDNENMEKIGYEAPKPQQAIQQALFQQR